LKKKHERRKSNKKATKKTQSEGMMREKTNRGGKERERKG
jgi:hypothetical protein